MKIQYIFVLAVCFFSFTGSGFAQSIQDIKKEKEKSEKEIAYLNKLLNEARNNKNVSLTRLNIIQKKIIQSKEIISSLEKEVLFFEGQMKENEIRLTELTRTRESMLDLYSKLIYNLWKKKDNTTKLMFIFSSSDFNQAYYRYKYFEQIQSYSKRQLVQISRLNDSLYVRNMQLKEYVNQKNAALKEIDLKNADLLVQQKNERQFVRELQSKEKNIIRKLQNEQKNRNRLAKELNKLIASQTKKSGSSTSAYKMTPEEKLVSEDFAKNKGKLPWPVNQGVISEKFGVNVHPIYKRVEMLNNGINISTLKNAEIRTVFNGVISEILFMPGFNNVIIIQHGNYFTVYSNLADIVVKKGQKVSTKQIIGKIAYDNENGSVLNFQVWKNMDKLDPESWLAH
ncbi:peptidoglycan DD-metalloendopeptidase family protein [uncultured Odoribacter sp.]|uniref:murein hydrolase activator EnvC family protein n=1 Tax=uncultured Odoribacter sp. TaxID=876416 RepID=UPI0026293DE7|nr:peptidoglycan DD-metalloendopeptidase family protein [uncultured Odoribacter sp.]